MREEMKDYVANNRESTADDRQLTRRRLAQGAAWSVPAVIATTVVPAYAASKRGTATATKSQYWHTIKSATPAFCNVVSNPQTGYIDNLPYRSPAGNSNTNRDPNTSNGYWVEGTAGTVTNITITTVYVFNRQIRLSSGSVLNGWSVNLASDNKTVTATYTAPEWQVSTSVTGSGDASGFYQPFTVVEGCYPSRGVTVTTTTTMNYTDANGAQVFTKKTGPTGI